MIGRLRRDAGQLADLASPRTLATLWRAGVIDPKEGLALGRALPTYVGRGASLGVISHINAVAVGSKDAVRDRSGSLTWRELDRRANRLARALASRGLVGERVAVLLRNGRELVEILLACQKVGVVSCPLNTWAKPEELRTTLERSEARLLIYDALHAEQVAEAAPDGLPLVVVGAAKGRRRAKLAGSVPYEDVLEERTGRPLFPVALDRGSSRVVIHTSGTTGKPKGASRDAGVIGLKEFAGLMDTVPLRRDDVLFCPAPLFHSFGLLTLAIGSLLGVTFVLPEKFDPEQSLALIEEHGATAASMVPVMIGRVAALLAKTKRKYDVSSLRVLLASGSAVPTELRHSIEDLFGDVLYDLYGSTEAGWVAIATPQDAAEHPGTVGRPVRGVEVAVFSRGGKRLKEGRIGELFVKSGARFEGYTSGETKDEREGFMSLGDLGRVEDGYLFVEGRTDDMVVVGGENVYPKEVEDVIARIDGVRDVAVLGAKDREYGQVLAAFVVGSASPKKIAAACRSSLASFKVPRRIEKVDELPRTSTGKVLKRELAALLEKGGAEANPQPKPKPRPRKSTKPRASA